MEIERKFFFLPLSICYSGVMNRLFPQKFIPVLQLGNPSLRLLSTPIAADDFQSKDTLLQLGRMWKVIEDEEQQSGNNAVGLAAPQIGWMKRVLALRGPVREGRTPLPDTIMINPVLRVVGTEKIIMEESCLSVRGFVGPVSRFKKVVVNFVDVKGVAHELVAKGWYAGLVQHEMDHLDGILYTDRVLPKGLSAVSEWDGSRFALSQEEDGEWELD
jgi:peptide deformylase